MPLADANCETLDKTLLSCGPRELCPEEEEGLSGEEARARVRVGDAN